MSASSLPTTQHPYALFRSDGAVPFGEGGALLWVNDDGVARLSVDSFDLGGTRYLGGWSTLLEALGAHARKIARQPSEAVNRPPSFLAQHLAPGEQLTARWYPGRSGCSPAIIISLAGPAPPPSMPDGPPAPDPRLTPREAEVASLVAQGYSLENVAQILEMSWGTVRVHLRHVYAKLGVVNRAQLTLAMVRRAPKRPRRRPA